MFGRASQLPHWKRFRKSFFVLPWAVFIPVLKLGALTLLPIRAPDPSKLHVEVMCSPTDDLPHEVDVL